jgi:hypothetical protein
MRYLPFGSRPQPLIQPGPILQDALAVQAVVGAAPDLNGSLALPPSTAYAVAMPAYPPSYMTPTPLPVEVFQADELLG